MNKRSYILGIGAGIIFSSCIFFATYNVQGSKENDSIVVKTIGQDEIVKRAEKLGMVFITDVLDKEPLKEEETIEEQIDSLEELENEVTENEQEKIIRKEITIKEGFTSYDVSKLLESEKIIEKKEDFDEFIYTKKVSKKINYGVFNLNSEMTYDEILNIITK